MIRRLAAAFFVALVLLALGITIRFGQAHDTINIFFELRGDLPGVTFRHGGKSYTSPLLFKVHRADPGVLNERYRGTIAPLELTEVDIDDFVADRYALLAELVPGATIDEVVAWSRSEPKVGGARVIWFNYLARTTLASGEPQDFLVLGLGIDDPPLEDSPGETRYESYYQVGRAAAIPIDFAGERIPLISRTKSRKLLSPPPERPERATIIVTATFGRADHPETLPPDESEAAPPGAEPERD